MNGSQETCSRCRGNRSARADYVSCIIVLECAVNVVAVCAESWFMQAAFLFPAPAADGVLYLDNKMILLINVRM